MDKQILKDKYELCFCDNSSLDKSTFDVIEELKKFEIIWKRKLKKSNNVLMILDFSKIKVSDRLFQKMAYFYFWCLESKVSFSIDSENNLPILSYFKNYDILDDTSKEKLINFYEIISIGNVESIYSYIYDVACDFFDNKFKENDICKFKDDSCECQRNAKVKNKTMGCCHEFYYGKDGLPVFTGDCRYLTSTGCGIKCLGCKIFTCKYLRKLGIKFKADDNELLRTFLNKKQKEYTNITYFTEKDKIIKKWLELH